MLVRVRVRVVVVVVVVMEGSSSAHEIRSKENENGNREQLEDDPSDHGVCSRCRVPVYLVRSCRGHSAADGLDDQGDYVAGAEDPEV